MNEHVETDRMHDATTTALSPADEDPVLQRYFVRLKPFRPHATFEDRVMARVFTPAPRWVQRARERQRHLADSKQLWWVLGGLIGTSFVSVIIAIVLIATNSPIADFLTNMLLGLAIPAWRTALEMITVIGRQGYTVVDLLALSGQTWIAIAAAAVAVSATNAWIFLRLIYPASNARLGLHAPG